jgi:hypothetical protein
VKAFLHTLDQLKLSFVTLAELFESVLALL